MAKEMARRTSFSGPALVRLLARLNDTDVRGPSQSPPDRLSHWLGWSDAIALAGALGGAAPVVSHTASSLNGTQEYDRVHKALSDLIVAVNAPAPARHRTRQPPAARPGGTVSAATIEFSTYRQRYIALQQTMETRCTDLRARLRKMLASRSSAMARLAAVDAVMEQALNEREFCVLARIPVLLEGHFKRLKQAALDHEVEPRLESAGQANAWLNAFHEDMQNVLFAELDIRLQPAQGLQAALTRRP
ncbi:DUF3348 domain-containing protein [Alcaligenaceae bacterium]|nr:DUF3348 domain-containing protein [Alcaligenaceae bacterium]